jgi:hypothetical protein
MSWNNSLNGTKFRIIAATEALVIGDTYFLSSFHDREGANVKVLSKSTAINSCGWPSSVVVEVIEPIGYAETSYQATSSYAPGTLHTVNATNLYKQRADASPQRKFAPFRRGRRAA